MTPENKSDQKVISILTVGSEILDGRIVDTNTHYLCKLFSSQGFSIGTCASCTDNIDHIQESLSFLLARSSIVVVTGGLGPTSDDLTREAIAKYFNDELIQDESLVRDLEEKYRERKRTFHPSNLRQATRPTKAVSVPNKVGTAPGLYIEDEKGSIVAAVPGIPRELYPMVNDTLLPLFIKRCNCTPKVTKTLRLLGLPESDIGGSLSSLIIPPDVELSYRVKFPEVMIQLRSSRDISQEFDQIKASLPSSCQVNENPDEELPHLIVKLMLEKKITLSVVESCTGGLVGDLVTNIAGSSQVFLGGIVAYSNDAKSRIFGISDRILQDFGAVSKETVSALSKEALSTFYSSIAISISGIAGPDGGSPAKPVGTFWVGYSSPEVTCSYRFFLPVERTLLKRFAAYKALDIVRRRLLGFDAPPDALEVAEVG